MYKVLWFTRLKEGVSADAYRAFVRAVDYPAAERIPSIIDYRSIHIQGPVSDDERLPYDFVDIATVADMDAYRQALEEHPAAAEVHGGASAYVEVIGTLVVELLAP